MHTNIIPDHNTRDQEQHPSHPSQMAASGGTGFFSALLERLHWSLESSNSARFVREVIHLLDPPNTIVALSQLALQMILRNADRFLRPGACL